jgi:hypothetical protein
MAGEGNGNLAALADGPLLAAAGLFKAAVFNENDKK